MLFSSLNGKNYLYNKNLKDLLNEIVNGSSNGRLLGNPTLAIGSTSAAKVKTSAFDYVKDGVFHTVASAETAFTETDHDIADGYEAIYNLALKLADDTFVITMGTAAETGVDTVVAPSTPVGHLKLGEVKIVSDGAAFDAGTTLLDAGTVTDTYTSKTDTFSLS